MRKLFHTLLCLLSLSGCSTSESREVDMRSTASTPGDTVAVMDEALVYEDMIFRISEIEVYPEYLSEYLEFARNVGAESVQKESGVICIFPMQQKRDSCQIRILEIYADSLAYRHHIQTDHFQTYKQGTLHMVKSLDLVDCDALDPGHMQRIFRKAGN